MTCSLYTFTSSYSTSNSISRSESGSMTPTGYRVMGSYQYRGPDGVKYVVEDATGDVMVRLYLV